MKHPIGQNTTTRFNPVLQSEQIQPNAVDLIIDKVFKINRNAFRLGVNDKLHRGSTLIQPSLDVIGWDNPAWQLDPGVYEVLLKGTVSVGPDEAGWIIPRSTLVRNGVFIQSGLYDNSYTGVVGCAMNVTSHTFTVEKGTRIAQFLLFDAESIKMYSGSYGTGTSDDANYS
jgi:dUTP pyrophosphatase